MKKLIRDCFLALAMILGVGAYVTTAFAESNQDDEAAVRALLAKFYQSWNAHDVDGMVSVYSDDVDHINVFAEWHRGKDEIRKDLTLLHTKAKYDLTKKHTVEKIRFIKPDVAVAQVRSISTVGNLGTYVLVKNADRWEVVSFTNVSYKLATDGEPVRDKVTTPLPTPAR